MFGYIWFWFALALLVVLGVIVSVAVFRNSPYNENIDKLQRTLFGKSKDEQ